MSDATYRFERHARTPNSEIYHIQADGRDAGRIDLHYGQSVVYGTLVLLNEMETDLIFELIETIDERLVLTADVPRDDFVITVLQGRQLGVYSDDSFEDDDDVDDEDLEDSRNGH